MDRGHKPYLHEIGIPIQEPGVPGQYIPCNLRRPACVQRILCRADSGFYCWEAIEAYEVEGSPRQLHPIVRDEVHRIACEAIRNACAHSEASRLRVELSYLGNLTLRVLDNGKGIDPEVASRGKGGHFGLIGMRERASRVGGKLTLLSAPGAGTEVELVVPRKIAFQQSNSPRTGRFEKIRRFL